MMSRALARSMHLDRQDFLDGLDHHVEKQRDPLSKWLLWKSTPGASAMPTAQALG